MVVMTARQIEAARRAMTRYIKRGGKIWIRVFPDKPISKKPLEVRQGKGKGNVEYWVCPDPARPHPLRNGRRQRKKWRARRSAWPQPRLPMATTFVNTAGDVMKAAEMLSKEVRLRSSTKNSSSCAASSSTCAWQQATGEDMAVHTSTSAYAKTSRASRPF